jgi:hypothetical protein
MRAFRKIVLFENHSWRPKADPDDEDVASLVAARVDSAAPRLRRSFSTSLLRGEALQRRADDGCGWLSESAQRWRSEKNWRGLCLIVGRTVPSSAWWPTKAAE